MDTITVPPELDRAITEEARRKGTTPELLAIDELRERFLPSTQRGSPPENHSMAAFLGDLIGCFDSREVAGDVPALSEGTGRKFAELMLAKRRAGKL